MTTVVNPPAAVPTTAPPPAQPVRAPRQIDPREPEVRLAALLDPGTLQALHPSDTSGVLCSRMPATRACRAPPPVYT